MKFSNNVIQVSASEKANSMYRLTEPDIMSASIR